VDRGSPVCHIGKTDRSLILMPWQTVESTGGLSRYQKSCELITCEMMGPSRKGRARAPQERPSMGAAIRRDGRSVAAKRETKPTPIVYARGTIAADISSVCVMGRNAI
jgi:hypothetical protein